MGDAMMGEATSEVEDEESATLRLVTGTLPKHTLEAAPSTSKGKGKSISLSTRARSVVNEGGMRRFLSPEHILQFV
ncbi:Hypothetical predicted protein [Olea europaea subsp. europaea]|uniref:Uncharacterized protein n=1 Tax=Olea europaea subsp. europaea TaxID=158383 RepID=A0A8S0QL74_OLEEU|nr:Hypothetical predicted protein [Olea europaea subsp. europaea]